MFLISKCSKHTLLLKRTIILELHLVLTLGDKFVFFLLYEFIIELIY